MLHRCSRRDTWPRELARVYLLHLYHSLYRPRTPLFQPQDEPQKVFPGWSSRSRESRTREYFLVHPRVDLILRLVLRLTWLWIWKAERRRRQASFMVCSYICLCAPSFTLLFQYTIDLPYASHFERLRLLMYTFRAVFYSSRTLTSIPQLAVSRLVSIPHRLSAVGRP